MENSGNAILAYFGPKSSDTGNHPKSAGKRFCNGKESFCNGVVKRDGDSGIAKQPRKGLAPSMEGAPCVFCNGIALEHSGEASGKYLIAPYGDWKNGDYIQRVDAVAAENLKRNMGKVWHKIKSAFGNPCPVHYEHPDGEDDKEVPDAADKTPYGKVKSLEALADGIYANIEWLPGFAELPRHLQISARWNADFIEGNIARPKRLLSLGLTRRPNIKRTSFVNHAGAWTPLKGQAPYGDCQGNAPIPNSENQNQQKELHMDKEILTLLGYTDEESQKIIDKAADAPSDVLERIKKALTDKATLENELAAAKGETAEKEKELGEAKTALANSQTALKASREARAKLVVANAVRDGKIAEFQRESAVAILANAEDFEAEEKKIAEAPAAVKTTPKTDGIEKGEKERAKNQQDAQTKFAAVVEEKQKAGMDYNSAWNAAKAEKPELYAAAYPQNS